MVPLAAALLRLFLCFLCRLSCLFLFRGLLCGFLLLRRLPGCLLLCRLLLCHLLLFLGGLSGRFLFRGGLAAAAAASGGSSGFGRGRWWSGHNRLTHCRF